MSTRNPFLPTSKQAPVINPFMDPTLETRKQMYAALNMTGDEEFPEEDIPEEDVPLIAFSDKCYTCWVASGQTTKFRAGAVGNCICKACGGK